MATERHWTAIWLHPRSPKLAFVVMWEAPSVHWFGGFSPTNL